MELLENEKTLGIFGYFVVAVFAIFDEEKEWVPAGWLYNGEVGWTHEEVDHGDEPASEDDEFYLNRGFG